MKLSITGVMVAVAAVIAGCQTTPGHPPGRPPATGKCNEQVCHILVKVDNCQVSAVPETLGVSGANRELHWDIDSGAPGYTFAPDGIAFGDDPGHDFVNLHSAEQNRKYVGNDKNTFPRSYKYAIRLMRGAEACPVYDPWIVNN